MVVATTASLVTDAALAASTAWSAKIAFYTSGDLDSCLYLYACAFLIYPIQYLI